MPAQAASTEALWLHLRLPPSVLGKRPHTVPPLWLQDARQLLMEVYQQVRALDVACGGGLTAVADVLLLYAATLHWFTCGELLARCGCACYGCLLCMV